MRRILHSGINITEDGKRDYVVNLDAPLVIIKGKTYHSLEEYLKNVHDNVFNSLVALIKESQELCGELSTPTTDYSSFFSGNTLPGFNSINTWHPAYWEAINELGGDKNTPQVKPSPDDGGMVEDDPQPMEPSLGMQNKMRYLVQPEDEQEYTQNGGGANVQNAKQQSGTSPVNTKKKSSSQTTAKTTSDKPATQSKRGSSANTGKKENTSGKPVFTTFLYSTDKKYTLDYLKKAAAQAQNLDRLNGITNTRVVALTYEQLNNDKSLNLNPQTDFIYDVKDAPGSYFGGDRAFTNVGQAGQTINGVEFIGGDMWGNASLDKEPIFSPTDLGILLDHERVAHAFKVMVRGLFSHGSDLNVRLPNTIFTKLYSDDYKDSWDGIENPLSVAKVLVGTGKYKGLSKNDTYSKQSKQTIAALTQYIQNLPALIQMMQADEAEQEARENNKESDYTDMFKFDYKSGHFDYKSFDYGSNPDYTMFLDYYFKKNIKFDEPYSEE